VSNRRESAEAQAHDRSLPTLEHQHHGKGLVVPSKKRGRAQARASVLDSLRSGLLMKKSGGKRVSL
jgi:hypothetical protein